MKILILRFSSFGDIVQALEAPAALRDVYPQAEIHWAVRSDFASIVGLSPHVQRIWTLDRQAGLSGLWQLIQELRGQGFTHIYDAHNNLRSRWIGWLVPAPHFLRRKKYRWKRLMLFRFRWNLFPWPFKGRESYTSPMKAWGVGPSTTQAPTLKVPEPELQQVQTRVPQSFVALAPTTAWNKKNWPAEHWIALIEALHEVPVVLLGGPQDLVIDEIAKQCSHPNLTNLRGQLSLLQSCAVVARSRALVSADTGLMHVADHLKVPTIALIGPSAFGYPSSDSSYVLEVSLPCKPCSKDGSGICLNAIYQRCMRDISPALVRHTLSSKVGL